MMGPMRRLLPLLGLTACVSAPPAACPPGTTADGDHCLLDPVYTDPSWDEAWPSVEPTPDECPVDSVALQEGLYQGCANVLEGDARLRTPAEAEAFCAQYDCVRGGVDVGSTEGTLGAGAEGFTDLGPLSCLRAARYLFVGNNVQLTEAVLPNLRGLGGALTFGANPMLRRVSLPALEFVGGDLSIQGNWELQTLEMPALDAVLEFLFIIENRRLPTSRAEEIRDGFCEGAVGGAIAIAGNGEG